MPGAPVFKLVVCLSLGALFPAARALAQAGDPPSLESTEISPGEDFLLTGDAMGGLLLGKPQSSLFGPGGSVAGGVYRSMGAQAAAGPAPAWGGLPEPGLGRRRQPGRSRDLGGLGSLTLALRVRPLGDAARATRAEGLWVEVAGGGGLTGDLFRPVAEAGVGWGFASRVGGAGPGRCATCTCSSRAAARTAATARRCCWASS